MMKECLKMIVQLCYESLSRSILKLLISGHHHESRMQGFYFKLKNSLSVGGISIRGIGMEVDCNGGLIVWANIIKRR